MTNDTCAICAHPKRLNIENLLLVGNVTPKFASKSLMLNNSIFVEETDVLNHQEHCMEAIITITAARRTLQDMQDNAGALLAAKRAYHKAETARTCMPYGHPDMKIEETAAEANRVFLDLTQRGIDLNTRYRLQVKAIDGKKRLKEVLANNAASRARNKAVQETQMLAMEYQASEQRKVEVVNG